jgi:hypothetical protein
MALGATQPPTEMSTRSISWGRLPVRKADNLPTTCAIVTKSGNLLEPSGPDQACNGPALPFDVFHGYKHDGIPNCA